MKGLVIGGEFGKILARQKSSEPIELGELLVAQSADSKILLQAIGLEFGSQISRQNLELISGMQLEEDEKAEFIDAELRNYNIAILKNLITFKENEAKIAKQLPIFFSPIRTITKEDITFLTQPKNPLKLGVMRSGSKTLDVPIYLDGKEAFSHHILIPATTGKGKSLDEDEEVLIEHDKRVVMKSIGELVSNSENFRGSRVLSMNPKNFTMDFKKISKFVRHEAPTFMYKVKTASGREVTVTGDHNLYVVRNGRLTLLKTEEVTNRDYLPLPRKISITKETNAINLFELLSDYKHIYIKNIDTIAKKFESKDTCIAILTKRYANPARRYQNIIAGKERVQLQVCRKLLKEKLTNKELSVLQLTDRINSMTVNARYSLSDDFLQFLGYYIAEGYCPNENTFMVSCSELPIRKHVSEVLARMGLHVFTVKKNGKEVGIGSSSSLFTKIVLALETGRVSREKRLPGFFMNLSRKNLRTLLRTYYEGDGQVDKKKIDSKANYKITTKTKSKKLASDICYALQRFGIIARCKKRKGRATNTNHAGGIYYRVAISGSSDLNTFLSNIGFQFSRKQNALNGKLEYDENSNEDVIPLNPNEFKTARLQTGLSLENFSKKIKCSQQILSLIESGKRRPSKNLCSRLRRKFKNFRIFSDLMNSRWDQVAEIRKIRNTNRWVYDLTIDEYHTFFAGHGGVFVHNSNLLKTMLWDCIDKDYCGMLVLDPHDEYYGRNKPGLKDHPSKNSVYYTPANPPPGAKSLKIKLNKVKPRHFNGVADWSDPQREALQAYHQQYRTDWVEAIVLNKPLQNFHEGTLGVVKRRIMQLLHLRLDAGQLTCSGVFDLSAGETTISDIGNELEQGKTVIIDTSSFEGNIEILIGSLLTTEIFNRYKRYKASGELQNKPVISIVLEEAPRVLGKEVLEKGPNIFSTIAREGRKFRIGLTAITQLPSLIPRQILANMNTKIILGTEMKPEREAIIQSAAQDLSEDDRTIASLDRGEAIVSSNFAKFATPIKIPLFEDLVQQRKVEEPKTDFGQERLG